MKVEVDGSDLAYEGRLQEDGVRQLLVGHQLERKREDTLPGGAAEVVGVVQRRVHLQALMSHEYRDHVRDRTEANKEATDAVRTQLRSARGDASRAGPSLSVAHFDAHVRANRDARQAAREADSTAGLSASVTEEGMRKLLFSAFDEAPEYTLLELVEWSGQPPKLVRKVAAQYCEQDVEGVYRLRPEYQAT